jgi:hypothetical protein
MPANERRLLPRKPLSVPVRYRVLASHSNQMLHGESLNWSDGGIFFITQDQLQGGHTPPDLPQTALPARRPASHGSAMLGARGAHQSPRRTWRAARCRRIY